MIAIDRARTAMLVVEMQNDLVSPKRIGAPGAGGALAAAVAERGVLPRFASLLARCRAAGVPVLYATKLRHSGMPQPETAPIYRAGGPEPILVEGTWGAQVADDLAPHGADVVLPRYTSIDPSHGSGLWAACERLGARTLIVAGVSTTFAVEGVVRAAVNRDMRAIVVEDCCAGAPAAWHEHSIGAILPLLATVATAGEIEEALA